MAARLATAAATVCMGRIASNSRIPIQQAHPHVAFAPRSNRASAAFLLVPAWRRFCVRAAEVSGPGSIDSLISGMQSKIKEQLKAQEVIVKDAYGDGRHVSIEVVSDAFEGQSAVNRQRMVYKAIWEELQNAVHAVDQLKTKTPAEAAAKSL